MPRKHGAGYSGKYDYPKPVQVKENPKNKLPITEQEERLNFYAAERNEPVPPPSEIISNVKHIPARPPERGVPVPDTVASGRPVKVEQTKPSQWWDSTPTKEKEILCHKWGKSDEAKGKESLKSSEGKSPDNYYQPIINDLRPMPFVQQGEMDEMQSFSFNGRSEKVEHKKEDYYKEDDDDDDGYSSVYRTAYRTVSRK